MKTWQGIPLVFDGEAMSPEALAQEAKAEAERAQRKDRKSCVANRPPRDRPLQRQQAAQKTDAAKNGCTASCANNKSTAKKIVVADALQSCDFLLNKDFKKNAKFYLCLFSASWCGPCRREMPRIAQTYAETLKGDPDIELIHFSRDQDDEKAMTWAKEHDVKFPVVKPKGGNPLDLHSRGIPHLFIVKADGTLVEEGHPMKIFNEEKFRELKSGNVKPRTIDANLKKEERTEKINGYTWSYRVSNGEAEIVAEKDGRFSCAVSPMPTGNLAIPSALGGVTVTRIGRNAFYQCRGLTSVAIPSTVTNIGRDAFNGCHGLTSPAIPSSVKDIGVGAFLGCGVTSVTISANVVNIGCAAFAECAELKEINVEEGNQKYVSVDGVLYTKDRTVLMQCPGGTESVTLPEGLKNIYWHALRGCRKLKSVTIPSRVREIGPWAFNMCGGLTSVVIPSNVASIGKCAFCDCSGLRSVSIPLSVTSIERYSFYRCGELTSVTIPSGVKSIGEGAFSLCRGLTSVTMRGGCPDSQKDVFKGCGQLKEIHVPSNSVSWAKMKTWQDIPLVFDGDAMSPEALAQEAKVEAERAQRKDKRSRLPNGTLRQRRLQQRQQESAQREEERAEQRQQLMAIQEELKRVRQAKDRCGEKRVYCELCNQRADDEVVAQLASGL